jgi:hypothetical protein
MTSSPRLGRALVPYDGGDDVSRIQRFAGDMTEARALCDAAPSALPTIQVPYCQRG